MSDIAKYSEAVKTVELVADDLSELGRKDLAKELALALQDIEDYVSSLEGESL